MDYDQTCDEFVKIMDQVRRSNLSKRRDLHMRVDMTPQSSKVFKTSDLIDYKPQGGGIYKSATRATTILRQPGPNRWATPY